ncbi:hypothetical protein ILUMI_19637 [Ignelater luminosus]|uniref:Uncharacterized protein n=1 Tax=Ignelater luminosus TaxID=2038154 RepID=A0A8K0CFU4_IGNLU|nr:hypothetical protein ILUMI_19637 [Ignelater luminosus]
MAKLYYGEKLLNLIVYLQEDKARRVAKRSHHTLAGLFNKAYDRVSTLEKATKGFEKSGIWPLNPEKLDKEDFLPARNPKLTIIADEEACCTDISG